MIKIGFADILLVLTLAYMTMNPHGEKCVEFCGGRNKNVSKRYLECARRKRGKWGILKPSNVMRGR